MFHSEEQSLVGEAQEAEHNSCEGDYIDSYEASDYMDQTRPKRSSQCLYYKCLQFTLSFSRISSNKLKH